MSSAGTGADTQLPSYQNHALYMSLALNLARNSPPKPTNFCVGACLVSPYTVDGYARYSVLSTGYTLEQPGNTHAEQCCFIRLAAENERDSEYDIGPCLPDGTVLYTTMEPCNQRSVGNLPCVDRILGLKREDGRQAIQKVYVGVKEPDTFVGINKGRRRLEDAGIEVIHVPGFEDEILKVATAGHPKEDQDKSKANDG